MDLIISDIHADITSLETILKLVTSTQFEKKYGQFSRILNLGDILERGTHPKQVLDKLESLSLQYTIESIMGNHDEAHLYGRTISGSSQESLDTHFNLQDNDLEFFVKNKDGTFGRQQYVDSKNNIICVHGGNLDPKTITPKDAGDKHWLYQKTWQRLSEKDSEFFSYFGYHYKPYSAFTAAKNYLEHFIIFCGHQHIEGIIEQSGNQITNLLPQIKPKKEKIFNFILKNKEISIKADKQYIIRIGLGGNEGYYGTGISCPHFGIINYDLQTVNLFSIIA